MIRSTNVSFALCMQRSSLTRRVIEHYVHSLNSLKEGEVDKYLHYFAVYVCVLPGLSFSLVFVFISVPYQLVIICSSDDEEKSHIISKLHNDRRPYMAHPELQIYRDYLKWHYQRGSSNDASTTQYGLGLNAACVDHEKYVD